MTFASYIRRERIVKFVNFWRATLDCRCDGQHSHENESSAEKRCEPFIRAVFVLDKTCSYKWYSSRLIFPCINGPIVLFAALLALIAILIACILLIWRQELAISKDWRQNLILIMKSLSSRRRPKPCQSLFYVHLMQTSASETTYRQDCPLCSI